MSIGNTCYTRRCTRSYAMYTKRSRPAYPACKDLFRRQRMGIPKTCASGKAIRSSQSHVEHCERACLSLALINASRAHISTTYSLRHAKNGTAKRPLLHVKRTARKRKFSSGGARYAAIEERKVNNVRHGKPSTRA